MTESESPSWVRNAQVASGVACGGFGALGMLLGALAIRNGDAVGALAGGAILVGAISLGFILSAVLRVLGLSAANARKLSELQEQLSSTTGAGQLEARLTQVQEKLQAIEQSSWLSDAAKKALARPVELERFRRPVDGLTAREEYDEALRLIDVLEEHFELPHEANQMRVRVEDCKYRAVDGQAREHITQVRKLVDEDNFEEAVRQVRAFRQAFVRDPRAEDLERTVERARQRRYEALRAEWDRSVETFNIDSCQRLINKLRQVAEPAELPGLEDALEGVDRAAQRALKERFGEQVRQHQWSAAIETGLEILSRYPHSTMAGEFRKVRAHLVERSRMEAIEPAGPPESGEETAGDGAADDDVDRSEAAS